MTTIRDAAARCIHAFRQVKTALEASNDDFRRLVEPGSLDDELGRFRVFCGNLGVLQKGHSSLDYRLRDSPLLQENVQKLLVELQRNLAEVTSVLCGARLPYDQQQSATPSTQEFDDTRSEASTETDFSDSDGSIPVPELEFRFNELVDIVDNLYRLSMRIRNPTVHNRANKAAAFRQIDNSTNIDVFSEYAAFDRQHTIELIRDLRKEAGNVGDAQFIDDPLVDRLSRAVTRRRQQFKYWRKHRDKLSSTLVAEEIAEVKAEQADTGGRGPTDTEVKGDIQVPTDHLAPPASDYKPRTILSGTEATEHHKPLDDDTFETQTVTSVATTARDMGGHSIELPPPPYNVDGDRDFECPYCCIICPARYGHGRGWRNHLLQDLQSYVCTYDECPLPMQTFRSRREWLDHERSVHRKIWRCPGHPNAVYKSEPALQNHLKDDHQEQFTDSQLHGLTAAAETSTEDMRDKCPICLIASSTLDNLQHHLANHLERLAIFALPKDVDSSEERSGGSNDASPGMTSTRSDESHPPKQSASDARSSASYKELEAHIFTVMTSASSTYNAMIPEGEIGQILMDIDFSNMHTRSPQQASLKHTIRELLSAMPRGHRYRRSWALIAILSEAATQLELLYPRDEETRSRDLNEQGIPVIERKLQHLTTMLKNLTDGSLVEPDESSPNNSDGSLSDLVLEIKRRCSKLGDAELAESVSAVEPTFAKYARQNPDRAGELAQDWIATLESVVRELELVNDIQDPRTQLSLNVLSSKVSSLVANCPTGTDPKGPVRKLSVHALHTVPDSSDDKMQLLMDSSREKESSDPAVKSWDPSEQQGSPALVTATDRKDGLTPIVDPAKTKSHLGSIPCGAMPTVEWLYRHNIISMKKGTKPVRGIAPYANQSLNQKVALAGCNIVALQVDAIVNAVGNSLARGPGSVLNNFLHDEAGPAYTSACKALGYINAGDVYITGAGQLGCKYVLHASRPHYSMKERSADLLRSCYRKALELAEIHCLKSIAFPSLSTGGFGYPSDKAAEIALKEIRNFLESKENRSIELVVICVLKKSDRRAYTTLFPQFFPTERQPLWPTSKQGFAENSIVVEALSSNSQADTLLRTTFAHQATGVGLRNLETIVTAAMLTDVLFDQGHHDAAKTIQANMVYTPMASSQKAVARSYTCHLAWFYWKASPEGVLNEYAVSLTRSVVRDAAQQGADITELSLLKLLQAYIIDSTKQSFPSSSANLEIIDRITKDLRNAPSAQISSNSPPNLLKLLGDLESFFERGSPLRHMLSRGPKERDIGQNHAYELGTAALLQAKRSYSEAAKLNAKAIFKYDGLSAEGKAFVDACRERAGVVWLASMLVKETKRRDAAIAQDPSNAASGPDYVMSMTTSEPSLLDEKIPVETELSVESLVPSSRESGVNAEEAELAEAGVSEAELKEAGLVEADLWGGYTGGPSPRPASPVDPEYEWLARNYET